jgi:hypothetical protein
MNKLLQQTNRKQEGKESEAKTAPQPEVRGAAAGK